MARSSIVANNHHHVTPIASFSPSRFPPHHAKFKRGALLAMLISFSAGANINTSSDIQVPLPKAFGQPNSVGISGAMGSVSDRIAIDVPTGRRGMKPNLSLTYSSLGGSGIAGQGWAMGIGSIERWRGNGTPSVNAIIDGTNNDRFSYSLAGAGGELHDEDNDGVYRARIESVYRPFKKIADGWQMYDGQGVSYLFGSVASSRIDGQAWLIDTVQDPSGNTITYGYSSECELTIAGAACDSENQSRFLSEINYTGYAPTNDTGANRVTFEYEPRPDIKVAYNRGVREAQNLRLKQVSIYAEGQFVRAYRLDYAQYQQGISLLSTVQLIGRDQVSAITLRTLSYSERDLNWSAINGPVNLPVDLADAEASSTGAQLMDVNGDGFADIINNGLAVFLGNGQGDFSNSSLWSNSLINADASIVDNEGIDTGVRFLDVDGDARVDILVATPTRTEVWLNTGSGWQQSSAWSSNLANLSALSIALVDADASTDCRAPLCSSFGSSAPAGCSAPYCSGDEETDPDDCLTLEEGETAAPFCESSPNYSSPATEPFSLVGELGESTGVEFADVNADGRVDIIWSLKFDQSTFLAETPRIIRAVFLNGGNEHLGWYQSDSLSGALANVLTNQDGAAGAFVVENAYEGYSFMDVNGDGLADIIRSIENKQAVYLSNGAGWHFDSGYTDAMTSQSLFALDSDFGSQGLIPIDFNDDGLVDYMRAKGGSDSQVYRNTGTSWQFDATMSSLLQSSNVKFVDSDGKATGSTMADVDGNGIVDLIVAKEAETNRILLGDNLRSGKLTRAVSALGQTTEITWVPSTQFTHTNNGVQTLPVTLSLVRQVIRADGRGNSFSAQLDYQGGQYTSEGFLGFSVVKQHPSAGLATETYFYQDTNRTFQPYEIRSFDSQNVLRALSESDTLVRAGGTGITQVMLKSTKTQRFSNTGALTTTSWVDRTYDAFMQPLSVYNDLREEVIGDESTARYEWHQTSTGIPLGFWASISKVTAFDGNNNQMSQAITAYNAQGLPISSKEWIKDDQFVETQIAYDEYGNVTTVTDRTGQTTQFAYDATGRFRVQATDPLGHIRRSLYDSGFGTLIVDIDADGNATTTDYDTFGRKVKITAPGDEASPFGTVSYQYSPIGDPNAQFYTQLSTENAGTSEVFEEKTYFDALGKVYRTEQEGADGVPIVMVVEFGNDGQASASSLPYFDGDTPEMLTSERDDLGRIVKITDPLNQQIQMSYEGFQINILDGRGNTTQSTVDPAGNPELIVLSVDGQTQTTQYKYDSSGRLLTVIDALGHETLLEYDGLARKTKLVDPNSGTYQYGYDAEGRLTHETAPDGKTTVMHYSANGQLVEKQFADGTRQQFIYGTGDMPNALGQLVKVIDMSGTMELFYDTRGRVIERRRTVDNKTYVTGLVYDSMNRIRQIIYPDGFVAHYRYDAGNNLAEITDDDNQPIAAGFKYNASQRITEFDFGNGVNTNYHYDVMARMLASQTQTQAGITLQELTYQYDAANNVLSMNDLASGNNQSFEYDEANRLIKANGNYGEETYAYDAVGNLVKKGDLYFSHDPLSPQRAVCAAQLGTTTTGKAAKGKKANKHSFDPCVETIAGIDLASITRAFAIEYDGRGNVIAKGEKGYGYDNENRLVRSTDKKGRTIEINRYDASGALIVKQDRNEKTIYIDGLYEEGKTHVSRHIHAGTLLVATVITPKTHVELISAAHAPDYSELYMAGIPSIASLLLLLWGYFKMSATTRQQLWACVNTCRDNPQKIALILVIAISTSPSIARGDTSTDLDSEQRFYYHANHLGSVNIVTDEDAEISAQRDYRPYGDPIDWQGANAGPREVLQTFQGQQFNDDTGLYNFKARYYDSELGRFMSADTVVADLNDPRTFNRYAFSGGNPIQFVDPTGRSFWSSVGDFFTDTLPGAFEDAGNWIADHAAEILTVIAIIAVVVLIVVVVVATGGLAAIAAGGGLGAIAAFGGLGAAAGFATFGGIALSQGKTVDTGAFWQAAGTGLVLGALVGAAIPVAFAPSLFFAGGITSFAGTVAAGALVGAAAGGLEQAIACATGCGGVENLFLPVAQGVIIGGITGAIGGAVAGKFFPRNSGMLKKVGRFLAEPGKFGFTLKAAYSSYSSAGGPGLSGRRTAFGDIARLLKVGVGLGNENIHDLQRGDQSSYFYGALDNAGTGLTTRPLSP